MRVSLKIGIITLFLLLAIQVPKSYAQDSLTVVPGKQYAAGWLHNFFFGAHWRDLWATPIKVKVLDLKTYKDGLTPIKKGGGFQTKSLHFKGADGKFYKFRSIDKDPTKVLPKYFRKTFVAGILKDQISSSHPLSAFIVAPLLSAVGVLNAQPELVMLPDDPLLGEYREDYKNLLGTLAENPKDDTDEALIFAGADKVVKMYKIYEVLQSSPDNRLDEAEYLKARLMDIFLGDWDRHIGQWKWARFKQNGLKIWKPIPRDRDQAFSRYDGVLPWVTALAVPQIESFSEDYPQINDLTWSGRFLDRRLLVSLSRAQWDSITQFIQTKLSDEVITASVKRMPTAWFEKEGHRLIQTLLQRRDELTTVADKYYRMLFKYVSLYASEKKDRALVQRLNDEQNVVSKYKKGEKNPWYHRVFFNEDTKEIRLDMLGGKDTVRVTGKVNSGPLLRIIGGKDADVLIDESVVGGYFIDITPIPEAESATVFYDSGKKTKFVTSASTEIDRTKPDAPRPYDEETDNFNEEYEPRYEDRGHDWKKGGWFAFNSDDGFVIGGGPILYEHGFRKNPYVYRMELLASYATKPGSFRIRFAGDFRSIINGFNVKLEIAKTELAFTQFFGSGNDTPRDFDLESKDYYQIDQEFSTLQVKLEYPISAHSNFWFGGNWKDSQMNSYRESLLEKLQPYGLGSFMHVGFFGGFTYDTRDDVAMPREGVYLDVKAAQFPEIFDNAHNFTRLKAEARAYIPSTWVTDWSLAMRGKATRIMGKYPFYEATFIGGEKDLRGFNRERFAGDASLFAGVEWRGKLFPVRILIPGILGMHTFFESGRVYVAGERSDTWHISYGGGLWGSLRRRLINFSITAASSVENPTLYFTFGHMF